MSSKKTHPIERSSTANLAKTERRQWIRYPSGVDVTCRLFGTREDHSWDGELHSVSAVGAGLVCTCTFQRGAILEVRPKDSSWNQIAKLLMRVKNATMLPRGSWMLGCTFVRELTDEELRALL
jgi:hypothetical protein